MSNNSRFLKFPLKKISKKITYVAASLVLITAQLTPFIVSAPRASADGNGSPVACLDTTTDVVGSLVGTADLVTYNAGAGYVVDGVCIKSGSGMFGGVTHSGVLGNGTFEDECYSVSGVGSQVVTVTRIGEGNDCKGISHIDVVKKAKPASITVKKNAIPDSDQAFSFSTTGLSTDVLGFSLIDDAATGLPSKVFNNLQAGSYIISEDVEEGWKFDSLSCSGGRSIVKNGASVTINLLAGENVVCTYKNNIKKGSITLFKSVVNNNGADANSNQFGLSIDGNGVLSGEKKTLNPGNYAVNEVGLNGYSFVSITGDGCPTNLGGNVVLQYDQNITCTITNDDDAPKLTLVKKVNNNNGGSATATDWTLSATGTVESPTNLSGAGGATSGDNFKADTYTLGETGILTGYTGSSWSCIGGLIDGDEVIVANGEDVTCTITNDDDAPSLTLVKTVTNDSGGKRIPADWTLTATGTVESPTNLSGAGGASSTLDFKADTYTLGETGPMDYTAGAWGCTNSVSVNQDNEVVLTNGQATTCTINNNDNASSLTLIKIVVNSSGGTEIASAWTLIAQEGIETPVINEHGATIPDTKNLRAATNPVSVGAGIFYTLSESGPSGYTPSSWSCNGGTLTSRAVKLAFATSVTCTITNNDDAPKLTLYKEVINNNSGETEPSDWTLSATPTTGTVLSGNGEDGFENVEATAGVEYTLSELGPDEDYFVDTDWICEGGTLVDNKLTLDLGTDIECLIVNNDISNPEIEIVKSGPSTAHEGEVVTYTAAISNTGDAPLMISNIIDNIAGPVALIYEDGYIKGDVNENNILDIDETWYGEVDYTVPSEQEDDIVNTMKVCADDLTEMRYDISDRNSESLEYFEDELSGDVCDEDEHTLDVLHPEIMVVKSGPGSAVAGSEVTYTFIVTNTGDVALEGITVNDSITGNGTYISGDTDSDTYLDIDETWIYEAKYTIPVNQVAPVNNTATACGYELQNNEEEAEGEAICDEDSHTLTIPQVLAAATTTPKVISQQVVLQKTGLAAEMQAIIGALIVLSALIVRRSKNIAQI